MITRARFQNFKALKDAEITFDERLTVIVGPNGSGKSSILKGIYWMSQIGGMKTFAAGRDNILAALNTTYNGTNENQIVEVWDSEKTKLQISSHPTNILSKNGGFGSPQIGNIGSQQHCHCKIISSEGEESSYQTPKYEFDFQPAELIQLDASRLAAPSSTNTTQPPLAADGSGLASLMAYFKLSDEPRYDQIVQLFKTVIPNITGVRLNRVNVGQGSFGEGLIFDLPTRKGVTAAALSDGTLYALGLIVKILDPQRPKLLLIDDIDHGFHPKAQLALVEILHKLLEEIPDLQIIATSHSPYILSGLKWDEIRVTSLKEDGTATIAPLKSHPNFETWKEAMSPGEFWSHAGEEWINQLPEKVSQ